MRDIYLNKDDKTLFLNKLNKLRKKSLCEACGKLCPGIYTEDDNSFKLEDTKLALEMMKLNGNVLDIGFGEFYFSKVIVNELGEKVHYTGIEPDEEKYAIIRKSYPGLELYNTSFEDFEYPDRSFDFILMIGTYNHIKDIRKCPGKCRLLLKTGGRLLIAETSLFILGVEPSKNSSFSRVPSD